MASQLRKTGISIIGDMPWGTHLCHFYETKSDLFDTLVPYFKTGLESKEFCLWVVSNSELITVEEAKGALAQAVPDLDRHLSEENIEILSGLDWFLEANVLNLERVMSAWDAKLKRALALGYDGMRVSGDTFWRGEKDWKDFCAYEKQVNDSITDRRMTVLCTYPLAKSGAAELLDVVQAHQFAIARRQGEWEVIESLELIQAKSEIERLNEALQRVKGRPTKQSLILRYGVAVLSVTAALIIAMWMESVLQSAPHVSLFLCAVMLGAWFGGIRPGLLAIALSFLAFAYILPPNYSLAVEINEIPRLVIFALSALFVGSLSAAQRSKAESLRRARDVLDGTVQEHKLTNQTLRAEITERKRAEALLHVKEQEFRAIVENAPDQIIRYDREFRRTYVNPAVAKAYGLPAEALTGKPIGSIIQDAGLDVKEDELAQVRQRIATVFDTGKSYEYEMNWPLPAGRGYFSVRLFPELDLNGSVINVLGIGRDITERRSAEEELKKEREILKKVFDNIPVMIGFVGDDGRVKLVNPEWERTIGWTLQELQEQNVDIFVEAYPDLSYRQEVLDFVAASTGESVDLKIKVRDGRVIDAACAVVHLSDGTKVAIAQDITERKQAEKKLKQSETQLAQAQHMAHVGSWNWDLKSNALDWSDELYRIFGVDPQAYDPAYEGFVMEFVHPEDRALVRGVIESSLKTQEPFSFYNRTLRPDGKERVIHARGEIVSDEQGNPIRAFGTAQDVTERKQAEGALREAEQKYRDIFENAGEGIFQSTPDGRYIAANPALARMYGFASPGELIHSYQDISRQVYVDPTRREEFKHQLEEQSAVRGFEHEVFRRDGSKIWISVNARAVREEQGAIQYYEGTAQDITERKAAEEKIKGTSEQLRALSARLQSAREEEGTRIAREIHDELGSMLTGLKWDLEEINKILFVPIDQLRVAALREKLQALIELTDMSVSALRRIASELRPSVLDDLGLGAAIEWQAQQFQARTGIICDCDCSLENVQLSEEQSTAFFRIFQEALTNVLRHAQATRVDITTKNEADYFVLVISDNGKGITEKEKAEQRSLGILGMKERVHLIGAEIDIKGGEGKGTVVTVRVRISGRGKVLKSGQSMR